MLKRQNAHYEERSKERDSSKRHDSRAVSPFDDMDKVLPTSPPVSADTLSSYVPNEFQLNAANAILPLLLHCRWRRATRRKSMKPEKRRATDTPQAHLSTHTTPSGGIRRKRVKSKCDACIPPHWRVSTSYTRKVIRHQGRDIRKPYINSKAQRRRARYCHKMRTSMQISKCTQHETLNASVNSTEHVHDTRHSLRHQRPPYPRGKRSGQPAGPGLPLGDSTGDDD